MYVSDRKISEELKRSSANYISDTAYTDDGGCWRSEGEGGGGGRGRPVRHLFMSRTKWARCTQSAYLEYLC